MRTVAAILACVLALTAGANAQTGRFTVDASVALSSFVTIVDGHFRILEGSLEALATTQDARSAQWNRIAPDLERIAKFNVPAALFFARPDGVYWTAAGGAQRNRIADRPYFVKAMQGNVSIGDLVVSRSTGAPVAVVAVPVKDAHGTVIGVLGGSVYLDVLSELVAREMEIGPSDLFWAIDSNGTIAVHSDKSAIFLKPAKMTPQLARVTADMLSHSSGSETYEFRGRTRTVVYRTSDLTGWHYGFGVIR